MASTASPLFTGNGGAVVDTSVRGPDHRRELTVTPTGIVIGGAYVRPAPLPGEGMEVLQRALLEPDDDCPRDLPDPLESFEHFLDWVNERWPAWFGVGIVVGIGAALVALNR